MGILSATPAAAIGPKEAAEQMEALLLQRLLAAAHLFGKSDAPGASLRGDLFAEALAEAVAKSGGLGIAKVLQPPENRQARLISSGGRAEALGEAPSDPRHV